MPRVNRDLQRRMAARRERERRRPSGERRYRFGAPEAPVETDESVVENGEVLDQVETEAAPAAPPRQAPAAAPPAPRTRAATTAGAKPSANGGVQTGVSAGARTGAKPFSAYKDEYAYVYGDLRRVALVIGSLLVILIALYFVLPLVIH